MATLSQTLGTSRQPNSQRYAYGGGTYGYGSYARRQPSLRIGANLGEQQMPANQGLYAGLMLGQQQMRPQPSTQFQAQYNFDPVLARLSALGEMSVENARAEAAALRKKALIESGAEDVAGAAGADANTVEAARQNPTSSAALLKRDFAERSRQMDEALQQQNLFYSGERANRLGELEFGRGQAESDFLTKLKDVLKGIDAELMAREQAAILQAPPPMAGRAGGGGGGGVPANQGGGEAAPPPPPLVQAMPSTDVSSLPVMPIGNYNNPLYPPEYTDIPPMTPSPIEIILGNLLLNGGRANY